MRTKSGRKYVTRVRRRWFPDEWERGWQSFWKKPATP
jgi:hypothetical protein